MAFSHPRLKFSPLQPCLPQIYAISSVEILMSGATGSHSQPRPWSQTLNPVLAGSWLTEDAWKASLNPLSDPSWLYGDNGKMETTIYFSIEEA